MYNYTVDRPVNAGCFMVVNVPAVQSICFSTAARCLYEHPEYLDFYCLCIEDSAPLGHEEQYIIFFP